MTGTMNREAVWAAIDTERRSIADLLDDLSDDEWGHPSLCAAWRVGDVAAHLSLAQIGPGAALAGAVRARGNFDRMIRDTALRHAAAAPRRQVTATIRGMAGSRRRAPGVTHLEPLIDVLVHGQDIALPLGRTRAVPVDAAATAATRVWTVGWPLRTAFAARRRLAGLRLVATDTDWSAGEGQRVEGPIDALLLLLTGRTAALDRLSGPGVERLMTPAGVGRRGAAPGGVRQAAAMTTPEPNETVQQSLPEPRDIALEMETPEQAADLEAQSDSAKGTNESTTD